MHNKFKELAEQAGANIDTSGRWVNSRGFEKFAELIVRECALTAGLMEQEGRSGIGAQILDNFGVEL